MVSLNWDSKRREFMCPLNRVSLYGNLHFLGFHYAFLVHSVSHFGALW